MLLNKMVSTKTVFTTNDFMAEVLTASALKIVASFKTVLSSLRLPVILLALSVLSQNAAALGLGALDVKSNLDQPLLGKIEIRLADGDDLDSVVAQIAPREDFETLGIDYPDYVSNLTVSLETSDGRTVLNVVSGDIIIKEPFIHFLVRVDWSGGSFLREYTALIDPPVYASDTPKALAQPKIVGTDQSYQTDNYPEPEAQDIDAVDEVFAQDSDDDSDQEIYAEDYTDQQTYQEEPELSVGSDQFPTDAQYGPVAYGESLSLIAEELQRQFPDLSIYQIMQVLFEENQGAFIDGNINGLLQGSVLNVGDINAIRSVEIAQAKQFFYQHLTEWDPSLLLADSGGEGDGLLVAQDEYSYDDLIGDTSSSDSDNYQTDSFQVGAGSDTAAIVSGVDGDNRDGEVLALRQQIVDLEGSLSSSAQENQELSERISLLEGQLADMNRLISLGVEDADLANLESVLADQNDASDDDLLSEIADSVEFDSELPQGQDLIGQVDPSNSQETVVSDVDIDALLNDVAQDDEFEQLSDVNAVQSVDAQIDEKLAPTTSSKPAKLSFVDSVIAGIADSGLWKVLAAVGALLLGGLAFLFIRRRRVDEEFEISMLSIETQTQSLADRSVAPTITQIDDDKSQDRETSFLTVYSDSDALVQADEVDPIAEADVYIAYGRDEQAEEVMMDGIVRMPDRVDIKQKLLTLYHKNSNKEGFERIAEELYAQKDLLTSEIWQQVSLMGKDISPENPLFDMSTADMLDSEVITPADLTEASSNFSDAQPGSGDQIGEGSDTTAAETSQFTESADSEANQAMSIEEHSEIVDIPLAEEAESIHLINFDDDRSEMSVLDEVDVDALNLDIADDDAIEIDDDDVGKPLEFERIELADDVKQNASDEVSDLDIDEDYDEARTQYELAKVFVDLGDDNGARKILDEIVADSTNEQGVIDDAVALLDSMTSDSAKSS